MDPHPVGVSHIEVLGENIIEIIESWKKSNPVPGWFGKLQGYWTRAVMYLVTATDYFIRKIDNMLDSGPDKKATVLEAISEVYDALVVPLLPIYLRPLNPKIKTFVIEIVISIIIDFMVAKYRGGDWTIEVVVEQ